MKPGGKIGPIVLEGRYRLQDVVFGVKGKHLTFWDNTKGKECKITGLPLDILTPSTCPDVPTTQRLYEEGIKAVQPLLPQLQTVAIFQPSYEYPLRDIGISAPGSLEFGFYEIRLRNQRYGYEFLFQSKDRHVGKIRIVDVYDKERQLHFKFYNQALDLSFIESARKYLDPLMLVAKPAPDTSVRLSAEWLSFIDNVELARLAYEEAVSKYNCFGEEGDWPRSCNDQGGLNLLRRYFQSRASIPFEDFLRGERNAATEITRKILFTLYPLGAVNIPAIDLDAVGRPILKKKQGDKKGGLLSYRPDYLLNAMALLLQQKSNERYHLKEKNLASLNNSLTVRDGKLFFVDATQNNGEPLYLPRHELHLVLFGQSPVYAPGVNVGDYYLHDENGDGRIQAYEDSVSRKGRIGDWRDPQRILQASNIQEMLNDSLMMVHHPLPFNPDRFFKEGVSFEELRRWIDDVNQYRRYRKQYASNPLQDGAYRVFIFRESTDRFEDYPFWLSRFIAINDFDDVYVVPSHWGMEFALNEVAARDIPLDRLYIGTHGDGTLEREAVFFDRNRKLRFRRGGEVVFTGCKTSEIVAMTLGAQLFQHSEGDLVWSDVVNVPLPFGNFLPLSADGHFFETHFNHGQAMRTKTRYIVDPIPGGLF